MPDYSWVGIYLLDGDELCSARFSASRRRTRASRSTRASAAPRRRTRQTIIVDDVDADPRYLACSLETRSEIVVPIMRGDDGARRDRHRQRQEGRVRRRRSRAARSGRRAARAKVSPTMTHRITLIPGDGIGPEVTRAVLRVLDAAGFDAEWEEFTRRRRGAAGARHDAARAAARVDPQEQGRAQGPDHHADRRRASPASTSACARRSTSTPTCGRCGTCRRCRRAFRTSISSSCARTPRTSTPASSTSSSRASSRA